MLVCGKLVYQKAPLPETQQKLLFFFTQTSDYLVLIIC